MLTFYQTETKLSSWPYVDIQRYFTDKTEAKLILINKILQQQMTAANTSH
jgi:uncharacterized protein YaiL (DUF2058 family)